MGLKERIESQKRQEARLTELRRQEPAWLRRMREQGLPNVDHTADLKKVA